MDQAKWRQKLYDEEVGRRTGARANTNQAAGADARRAADAAAARRSSYDAPKPFVPTAHSGSSPQAGPNAPKIAATHAHHGGGSTSHGSTRTRDSETSSGLTWMLALLGALAGYAYATNTPGANPALYAIVGGLGGKFLLSVLALVFKVVKIAVVAVLVLGAIALIVSGGDDAANDAARGVERSLAPAIPRADALKPLTADALATKASNNGGVSSSEPTPNTDSSTSSGDAAMAQWNSNLRAMKVQVACHKEVIYAYAHYMLDGSPVSAGWWRLAPGSTTTLTDAEGGAVVSPRDLYYYAEATDGSLVWTAREQDDSMVQTIGDKTYRFRRANNFALSSGEWLVTLVCTP